MAVRPASLTSKAHRRLTAALDRRHTRVNRVQHTVTVLDPKKAKSDREKQEEARIRSRRALPCATNAAFSDRAPTQTTVSSLQRKNTSSF